MDHIRPAWYESLAKQMLKKSCYERIEWKSEGEADFFDCSWESSFIKWPEVHSVL